MRVEIIEAHDQLMQHVEKGRSKIRVLSVITMAVALLFIDSYFSQLILPYTSGTRFVKVDLLDPTLILIQILIMILAGAWLYIGAVNYLFATRLGKSIQRVRAMEKELEAHYPAK